MRYIRHHPSDTAVRIESPVNGNVTTRGLSETEDSRVVGSGRYGVYDVTTDSPAHLGAVTFVDKRSGLPVGQILVPEAPCCIVRNPWCGRPA